MTKNDGALPALLDRLRVVEVDCPACGRRSPCEAPFDLVDFACPKCRSHLYPFARIRGGDVVDLNNMRELLAASFVDSHAASELLERLYVSKHEGRPTEALIDRGVVVAHAIANRLRHTRPAAPWYLWLAGVVHPALGVIWPALALVAHHDKATANARALEGPLSPRHFDPCTVPAVPSLPQLEAVLRQTAPDAGWNEVLETDDLGTALGANRGSSWSLTVDRADRCEGWGDEVSDVNDEQLVAEVVSKVVNGTRSEDTARRLRRVTMLNRNRLPSGAVVPSFDDALEKRGDVRSRDGMRPLWGVETLDYSSGRVVWSFVRSSRQGHLSAIQWQTFVRKCPGRGAYFSGRHVDADDALLVPLNERAEREVESTWLERLQLDLRRPRWLAPLVILVLAYWYACVMVANSFENVDVQNWFRATFAALALASGWRQYHLRRRPFPHRYWSYRDLPSGARAERRRTEIHNWVQNKLRRLEHNAQPSAFGKHGALRQAQSLDAQDEAFHVYAQDRALQDAVIEVAESHGIDMSKFKEGLQQINNYGVIAGSIAGPVATGPSAQANAKTESSRKSILPAVLRRGHTPGPQQRSAAE